MHDLNSMSNFFDQKIWRFQKLFVILQPILRKVGRVIDRAGLEILYTLFGYRGFESLTFRQGVSLSFM